MNAIVCACGRRVESDDPLSTDFVALLRRGDHDPDECSRQMGFQSKLQGRHEMIDATMSHLLERRSLGVEELAEIKVHLVHIAGRL